MVTAAVAAATAVAAVTAASGWLYPSTAGAALAAVDAVSPASQPAFPLNPAQQMERLAGVLQNAQSPATDREEAARQLLARRSSSPAAKQVLDDIMHGGDVPAQTAVARGIADDPNPDPAFIPQLAAMIGPSRSLSEAAAIALVNYTGNTDASDALRNAGHNAALPEPVQLAVIRAMGGAIDKSIADYLVTVVVNRPGTPQATAAATALEEMTGQTGAGLDRQHWQQWWNANQHKPIENFQSDLLSGRARGHNQTRQRYQQLAEDVRTLLSDQFGRIPDARKVDELTGYLTSRDPALRAGGAQIVTDYYAGAGRPVPTPVRERLRLMVTDSDENVRRGVISAIFNINDHDAAPALIAAQSQEKVPEIRELIIRSLGRMGDPLAVPNLLTVLEHGNLHDAELAAQALAELGPTLRSDPALSRQTTDALTRVLNATAGNPEATSLRAACAAALGALRDPQSEGLLLRLLRPAEPFQVHKAAITALGELHDPNTAEVIAHALESTDKEVRLAAANALKGIASFALADQLYSMLDPHTGELDPQVRDAVWEDLKQLLHTGTSQQLISWPDKFKNDPPRRLEALYALCEALTKEGKKEQLAFQQQTVAETLMQLQPPHPDEAIKNLQAAIDYWKAQGRQGDAALYNLIGQMLNDQLAARKYDDAVAFAAKQLETNPQYMEIVGRNVKQEADTLRARGDNAAAIQLIDAAMKMQPPLDSKYQRDLKAIRDEATAAPPAAGP
jgi:HEAT repeat protein